MEFSLPILDLIGPLHVVNVHSDLVLNMMGQLHTARSDSCEHDTSPELPLIQQLHGLVDEADFCWNGLQLVQVDTLTERTTVSLWHWWPWRHVVVRSQTPLRGRNWLPELLNLHHLVLSKVVFQVSTKLRTEIYVKYWALPLLFCVRGNNPILFYSVFLAMLSHGN